MKIRRLRCPIGAISSLLIFLYSVQNEIWKKLDPVSCFLFNVALICLFLADLTIEE